MQKTNDIGGKWRFEGSRLQLNNSVFLEGGEEFVLASVNSQWMVMWKTSDEKIFQISAEEGRKLARHSQFENTHDFAKQVLCPEWIHSKTRDECQEKIIQGILGFTQTLLDNSYREKAKDIVRTIAQDAKFVYQLEAGELSVPEMRSHTANLLEKLTHASQTQAWGERLPEDSLARLLEVGAKNLGRKAMSEFVANQGGAPIYLADCADHLELVSLSAKSDPELTQKARSLDTASRDYIMGAAWDKLQDMEEAQHAHARRGPKP